MRTTKPRSVSFKKFLDEFNNQQMVGPTLRMVRRLKKGDLVDKSSGLTYRIDDIGKVLSLVGEHPDFPYGPIHRMLKSDAEKIRGLFHKEGTEHEGKRVLPFSRVVECGLGECLEKSVLSHLVLQEATFIEDQFLVSGNISHYPDPSQIEFHTYNIAKRNGEWVLIDTENPHRVKDKKTVPYIVPIKSVTLDRSFPLELEEEKRGERRYHLKL